MTLFSKRTGIVNKLRSEDRWIQRSALGFGTFCRRWCFHGGGSLTDSRDDEGNRVMRVIGKEVVNLPLNKLENDRGFTWGCAPERFRIPERNGGKYMT